MAVVLIAALSPAPLRAQAFPDAQPVNRSASGAYSLRNLALGEQRFTNEQLYNLYDQGGSPMGLLETHTERLGVTLGLLRSTRATPGDTLTVDHHDYYIPQLSFFQPGVFGAILYYQPESESFRRMGGDSLDFSASRFGLDLAAGPASGLFRLGFSAHARLGDMNYPGKDKRIVLEAPSLRMDLGSRVHAGVEVGVFAGVGGHFDSLENAQGRLERVATMTLPKYGALADVDGWEAIPLKGNTVLEFGTDRSFGEYRQINGPGVEYPIFWNSYWTLQSQWMYPFHAQDFRLEPALRFAHRGEDVQGYLGIKGNQNPFKKGDKISGQHMTRSVTDYGLGGNFGYKDWVTLMLEWETSGHEYKLDSAQDQTYDRFTAGVEPQVDKLPFLHFPEGMTLALRAGWTWRQDQKGRPGYEDYQFNPFVSSVTVPTRNLTLNPKPDAAAAYSAFHLGFAFAMWNGRLGLEGLLGFPKQIERVIGDRTGVAAGTELGLTAKYQML